jgi:hypothetical protein
MNILDSEGLTPLHTAVKDKLTDFIVPLMEAGASAQLKTLRKTLPDDKQKTAIGLSKNHKITILMIDTEKRLKETPLACEKMPEPRAIEAATSQLDSPIVALNMHAEKQRRSRVTTTATSPAPATPHIPSY